MTAPVEELERTGTGAPYMVHWACMICLNLPFDSPPEAAVGKLAICGTPLKTGEDGGSAECHVCIDLKPHHPCWRD